MKARAGFTLIELSIVIAIIGLLIGGVLAGQSLIRASELRAVATEANKFKAAVNAFHDEYHGIPGDLVNATQFWGAQVGGTANGVDPACAGLTYTSPATDQRTCNGDGDGRLLGDAENLRFWQQLSNAGLIEGTFTGVSADASGQAPDPGKNVPASRAAGAAWTAYWRANEYLTDQVNVLIVGGGNKTLHEDGMTALPAFKPDEAFNMDKKLDDGNPATGNVQGSVNSVYPNCITADNAGYQVAVNTKTCAIFFLMDY